MQKIYDRDLTVDYTVRCVTLYPETDALPAHQMIRYGLSADEIHLHIVTPFETRDLDAPYAELSCGGRRPGQADAKSKHYFNKRIMLDGESIAGRPLRGGGDRDDQQARDASGGVGGAGQVAFPTTVAGGGAGDARDCYQCAAYRDGGRCPECVDKEVEPKPEAEEGNQEEVT